ncbi:MAG: SIMPL domain-containing protein [Actinobacteria bacterium]|nr:SIMPL domain-containing protein [Actinomycetota bacterium]
MRSLRILGLASLLALATAYAGFARPDAARGLQTGPAQTQDRGGLTVSGLGSVASAPDRADISFGVDSRGRTAREALAANAIEMRRVLAALREAGIAPPDIQTQLVSLSPVSSEDGRQIIGYTASNSVTAKVREIGRAGVVIDAAVEAGANQVYGPSLARDDSDALYRQALRAAVGDARAKAQALAAAGGVSVGRVIEIVEGGGAPEPMPLQARTAGDSLESSAPTPIEPGTTKIQASVSVTFAVQ